MAEFTIKDVLKKAIEMEEAGKIFYEYATAITDDNNIKEVFKVLANEEIGHKHIFENMLNKIDKLNLVGEKTEEEYIKYLNEHISTKAVFDRKKFEQEKNSVNGIINAIDFAMEREMDSILYYMTLMTLVREEQANFVQQIINEERKHFIKLSEAKKLLKK
jgi:rubrerythrin